MSFQTEPEKNTVYEKETIVRNATASSASGPRQHERYTEHLASSGYSNGKGFSTPSDDEPSLGQYLKGFSKVAKKCLRDYKEVLYDVVQSLLVLFMQHPSIGILFLVTGLFIVVPLGLFLGFAVVSFISIVVTALFIEGILLGSGVVILFFAVPIAFVVGISVAAFVCATWLVLNTAYSFFRGEGVYTAKVTTKME